MLILKRTNKQPEYTQGELYIDNKYFCDTLEPTDRGLKKDDPTSLIKQVKIPSKTAIPSGLYKISYDIKSHKYSQVKYYKDFCDGKMPRLLDVPCWEGVLIHCLDGDTEILTDKGWMNLDTFKENSPENCYSYNTNTGEIELTPINFYIESDFDGNLYCNSGKMINYAVTDQHRMWCGMRKHNCDYNWKFRYAKDITGSDAKFIAGAHKKDGWDITDQQLLFYRLIMAVQADGYILNWSQSASQVRFHLKKDRKIKRLKWLLDSLSCKYCEYVDSVNTVHISLDSNFSNHITEVLNPTRDLNCKKIIPFELLNLKSEHLRELVREYRFWDGRWENRTSVLEISSVNKNTIDFLQAAAVLSNSRTSVIIEHKRSETEQDCYLLRVYEDKNIVQPTVDTNHTVPYSGKVWCINNNNSTIIIRKNGRVCILGNCGNYTEDTQGCILVGKWDKDHLINSRITWEKLYNLKQTEIRIE